MSAARTGLLLLTLALSFGCTQPIDEPIEGVCCELQNPCTVGSNGGWAPSEEECEMGRDRDGMFTLEVDEHGCEVWTAGNFCGGGEMCCTRTE
ncbi:MAG: hypothetical protein SangKO_036950 [Sandaracinaceae bacterium]